MGRRGPLPNGVTPIRDGVTDQQVSPSSRGGRPKAPRKPDWLDEYGSRVWDRLIAELEPLGILNPSHRELLAAYCQIASVSFAAWKQLTPNRERGPDILVPGRDARDSQIRAKPWGILRESAALLDTLSKSLLTSPAALMRADLPSFEDDDESDLD